MSRFLGDDTRFDAVVLFQVIEHVAEPDALLEAIGRRLRPGGRLFLSCPGPRRFTRLIDEQQTGGSDFWDHPPHHVLRWTLPAFRAFFARHRWKVLTAEEEQNLARAVRISVVKRANSAERVLDDTVLLLHRAEKNLTEEQCRILDELRRTDSTLHGKTILVVDDDVRNIFALTSLLEEHNMKVVHADGKTEIWKARAGESGWLQTEGPHTSENIGKKTMGFVLVEIKSAANPATSKAYKPKPAKSSRRATRTVAAPV